MLDLIVLVAAILFGIAAYFTYYRDIARIGPNIWSWLIWSVVTLTESLTYQATNGDLLKSLSFFASSACCIVITIKIFRTQVFSFPSPTEWFCLLVSFVAIAIWLGFRETLPAHILTLAAVPISFVPTWIGIKNNPREEASLAWPLWSIGDVLTLGFIVIHNPTSWNNFDKPYAIVEFACHLITAIWLGIMLFVRKHSERGTSC